MHIDMTKDVNKKKIAIILSVALVVTGLIIGLTVLFTNINKPENKTTSSKIQAEKYKSQAITELKNNDKAEAKALFQKAKEQYQKAGNSVGIVDMDSMIYTIDHTE